ncbi:hypothetical protein ACJMK2_030676 [Sinanodonta woodiana]|uniref:Uncharacterized protein n=1 Tax=Sinanodonta woodiana TaxID=1069815 RepID=A0ABD3WYI1_SINWO
MSKLVGLIYLVTLFQESCLAPATPKFPLGCIFDGRHFLPGEEISRGREGSWCFGKYCSRDRHIIFWDNNQARHNNKQAFTLAKDKSRQQRTFEGRNESFCYGFYCNDSETLSSSEDWNCLS